MYPDARETLRGTQRNTYIDTQKIETHRVKINTYLNKKNKEIKNLQRDLPTLLIDNIISLNSP